LFTAMLTMAQTAQSRVLNQLAKGGQLAGIQVTAAAANPSEIGSDSPRPGAPLAMGPETQARIAALPGVGVALPIVTAGAVVLWDDQAVTRTAGAPSSGSRASSRTDAAGEQDRLFDELVGVNLSRAGNLPITVLAGRLPAAGSLVEVDVTPAFLARFGIDKNHFRSALGTEVELGAPRGVVDADGNRSFRARWTRAEVVGVVAQQAGSGGLLGSLQAVQADHDWTAAGDLSVDPDASSSPYSGLFVIAKGLSQVPRVRAEIANVGYSTSAPEGLI